MNFKNELDKALITRFISSMLSVVHPFPLAFLKFVTSSGDGKAGSV